jgi:hypothetical protein
LTGLINGRKLISQTVTISRRIPPFVGFLANNRRSGRITAYPEVTPDLKEKGASWRQYNQCLTSILLTCLERSRFAWLGYGAV